MLDKYLSNKLTYKFRVLFLSAILCGLLLAMVSAFAIVMSTISDNIVLNKLCFAIAFSGVLLLAVANGYELFTGNTMLLIMMPQKDMRKKIIVNLLLVYVGNLIGCVVTAAIFLPLKINGTFDLTYALTSLYTGKTELAIHIMLIKGFFANFMVCMGVYLATKGKNIVESYLGLFFPIVVFCVLGFEHSVANMFSLFYAAFELNKPILPVLNNLLFVTIGNIIGGVTFAYATKLKPQPQTQS